MMLFEIMFVARLQKYVCTILKLMQGGLLYPNSNPTNPDDFEWTMPVTFGY